MFTLDALAGGNAYCQTEEGWVWSSLYLSNMSSSNIQITLSPDRSLQAYRGYDVTDLTSTAPLPMSLDLFAGTVYWNSAAVMPFEGIGYAQIRAVALTNQDIWSSLSVVVWGTLEKDPRCYL